MPKPAFPNPAATLPGEADVLANVLSDLSDDNAKLVYADWLEEHDDPRGQLLRKFITAYRAGKKLPGVNSAPQSWRELVGITLMMKLRRTVLEPKTDQLLALARPALTFKSTKTAESSLPVAASKLGGCPDLPASSEWPTWPRGVLAFLGQFNLADLASSVACRELPATGLLSVFYDSEGEVFGDADEGGWRIFYFPDASNLVRHDSPTELASSARFQPAGLTFVESLTLPRADSPWEDELSLSSDERTVYSEFIAEPGLGHRVLGYAHSLQNDVYGRKGIRHLLTIDSDDGPGWMWGDCGLLYFTIAENDFQKRQFDHVFLEFQRC